LALVRGERGGAADGSQGQHERASGEDRRGGLAAALMGPFDKRSELLSWCRQAILATGGALLGRAQQAGAVRPDADISDLLKLVSAIASSTEQAPDQADRLLALVTDGLRHKALSV
jgi:hypothetical protein